MDLDDSERRQLADIERQLARSDRRLASRMALHRFLSAAHPPSWSAIAACSVLLALDMGLLILATRWHSAMLLLLTILLFPLVMAPLIRRRHRRRTP